MKKSKHLAVICCVVLLAQTMLTSCQGPGQEAPAGSTGSVDTTVGTGTAAENQSQEEASKPQGGGSEKEPGSDVPRMSKEEYPRVDGSTATLPLSMALYQQVTGATAQEAETNIVHSKTTNAYLNLIYDSMDLVIAYEPAQAVYDAMEEQGQKLVIKPIGKDALVFMANEGNPVKSLTERQLVDIYSGQIMNWSQVGGEKKEITAFQRPENSGSQTLMEKLVMRGAPMAEAPTSMVITGMGELIEKVASYNNEENALGYSVYFYARNMYEKPGLRFMAVDGVMPDNETIKSGEYPFVNEFYAAVREDEPKDSRAYQLFDWLTARGGQSLIESLGYVGMEDLEVPLAKEEPVVGNASIHLAGSERLLANGEMLSGADGIVVFGHDWTVEKTYPDLKMGPSFQLIDLKEPVEVTSQKENAMGLYRLSDDTWVVEPVYSYLYQVAENVYQAYRDGTGERCLLVWNEEAGGFSEKEVYYCQVGDYGWLVDQKTYQVEIIDGADNQVSRVDLGQYGEYEYGYDNNGFYIAHYQTGEEYIFDGGGTLVFSSEIAGRPVNVLELDRQGQWISGSWADGSEGLFVYSLKKQEIVADSSDGIVTRPFETGGGFTIVRGGKTIACDGTGEPVKSPDGNTYSNILGNGYYGYLEDGMLVIERPGETGNEESFRIPCPGETTVTNIAADIFCTYTEGQTGFYKGNELLFQNESGSIWWDGNYCVITDYRTNTIVLDQLGNVLYHSNLGEVVQKVYDEFMIVGRGNYWNIIDYDGNCALRVLSGYMADD